VWIPLVRQNNHVDNTSGDLSLSWISWESSTRMSRGQWGIYTLEFLLEFSCETNELASEFGSDFSWLVAPPLSSSVCPLFPLLFIIIFNVACLDFMLYPWNISMVNSFLTIRLHIWVEYWRREGVGRSGWNLFGPWISTYHGWRLRTGGAGHIWAVQN
jgi:hypothetical protein